MLTYVLLDFSVGGITDFNCLYFFLFLVGLHSPFYMDRITFELDLMAPVGKPFRKVIDINCSSGEWAMVTSRFSFLFCDFIAFCDFGELHANGLDHLHARPLLIRYDMKIGYGD